MQPWSRSNASQKSQLPSSSDPSRAFQVSTLFTSSPASTSSAPFSIEREMSQELLSPESTSPEAKLLAASKSHSEAERRRRERINNHLSTLRTLLPSTAKTDKASLLAEVIHRIKDLKRQVEEISQFGPVPSEVDELNVDVESLPPDEEGKVLIRASICCEDRPNLLTDLMRTLKSLHLNTIKAEIATLEGRTKNVLVMTIKEGEELESTLACVEGALRSVMEESSEAPPEQKRPRSS